MSSCPLNNINHLPFESPFVQHMQLMSLVQDFCVNLFIQGESLLSIGWPVNHDLSHKWILFIAIMAVKTIILLNLWSVFHQKHVKISFLTLFMNNLCAYAFIWDRLSWIIEVGSEKKIISTCFYANPCRFIASLCHSAKSRKIKVFALILDQSCLPY